MGKRKRKVLEEVIKYDDSRMSYYYTPWEITGETIRTSKLNDYTDIWNIRLARLEWWSMRGPSHGVAGFKIWGPAWEVQELVDLYSPTKENKIELIKAWDFDLDNYTITLLNTGEQNPEATGHDLVHAYFKIQ